MEEVIPMKSARIFAGKYEVLGTSTECIIEQKWFLGNPVGWALYSNGEFIRTFPTKRQALQYCQEHPEL